MAARRSHAAVVDARRARRDGAIADLIAGTFLTVVLSLTVAVLAAFTR